MCDYWCFEWMWLFVESRSYNMIYLNEYKLYKHIMMIDHCNCILYKLYFFIVKIAYNPVKVAWAKSQLKIIASGKSNADELSLYYIYTILYYTAILVMLFCTFDLYLYIFILYIIFIYCHIITFGYHYIKLYYIILSYITFIVTLLQWYLIISIVIFLKLSTILLYSYFYFILLFLPKNSNSFYIAQCTSFLLWNKSYVRE